LIAKDSSTDGVFPQTDRLQSCTACNMLADTDLSTTLKIVQALSSVSDRIANQPTLTPFAPFAPLREAFSSFVLYSKVRRDASGKNWGICVLSVFDLWQ